MAGQDQPAAISLDIAVDHRLRMLFKPIIPVVNPQGYHVQCIDKLGHSLARDGETLPEEEIIVTKQLAFPESTGGIAVALSQPANAHPFHLGTDIVISSSPTLIALDQAFTTVTCGSLSLRDDVTVIDRSPFFLAKDQISRELQEKVRNVSFNAISGKKPDVVLCMGQDRVDIRSSVDGFQSTGVGKTFAKTQTQLGSELWTKIVNAPHPSYVMNYNPHISWFRELILLEVAYACGVYKKDWVEEFWMKELRERCQLTARKLSRVHITFLSLGLGTRQY
jgi:hypothetical protein